jgi:hypothetical protein
MVACSASQTCVAGHCKSNDGVGCTLPSDCAHGNCADGVCCDTPCTDACTSCALQASRGVCTKVLNGVKDPHGVCVAHPASECGTTGYCAGGACAFWARGTVCGPGDSCTGDVLVANHCDGQVTCVSMSGSCHPYACLTAGPGSAQCAMPPCAFSNPGGIGCTQSNALCDTGCACVSLIAGDCGSSQCKCP